MFRQAQPAMARRWVMRELRSPDPRRRQRAIEIIGGVTDPLIVPQAFKVLARMSVLEPLPELRKLAAHYAEQMSPAVITAGAGQPPAAQGTRWNCSFCETKNIKGDSCPNCAAPCP